MTTPNLHPVSQTVSALFRESPFAQPGEYQTLQVMAGQSITDIVAQVAKPWQHAYLRVVLNGEVIERDQWPLTVPAAGDNLNILMVPQGDAGQILKQIAVIAVIAIVTYFTYGALTPYVTAGTLTAAGAGAIAAGVGAAAGLAAGLALNAVFPPPALAYNGSSGSSGVAEDPVYGFSKVSNAANPYGCIPRVYGRRKVMPQHAMNPVIISSGTNQYLYQAFTAGYGPLQIEDIRIGDTPIGNYSDVTIHVHENFAAGDTLHLINQDVWQDPFSIKLTQNTVNVIESTDAAQALALDLQFNQGLFWVDSNNGNFNAESVAIQLQLRLKGTDLWQNVGSYENSIDGGTLSGSTITVSRKSQRPFFVTVNVTLPAPGKYEIRAVRLTEDRESRESNKAYDTVYIASLRSIRFVAPIAPDKPISLIEIKIKATEQLNGTINNLSCIVTSKLPVYDGSNWTVQATRNPAWCYLDAMRGTAIRRPVKDSRILFGDMLEWATWCDTAMANAPGLPRAMCDLEITSATSVFEAMKLIAATGFATPTMVGNKYSIAIDRPRSAPVQLFTPRNSKLLDGSIGYHVQPHALRVQFTPTDETTADEVVVFDDGYSADGSNGTQVATRYEVMKVVGISRREQAFVIGRRSLAQGRLRIEQWTIQTDAENLIATRGSFVRFAHHVPMIGSGHGRVVSKVGQVITLDEPISATGTIYARVRRSDNTQQDYNVSSYSGDTLTLSGDPSAISEGDLLVYGNLNQITEDCFVKSILPNSSNLAAELTLVPYAPGVYTAEVADIPAYAPVISWSGGSSSGGTTGLGGVSTTPGQVNSLQAGVVISYIDNAPHLSVNLSWTIPNTGSAVIGYRVDHYTGGRWQQRAMVYETSAVAYSDYQFVDEAGQPVNMNGVSMLFAVSAIGADGSSLPPELAAQTSVTPQILGPASVASVSVVGGVFENKIAWLLATNGFDVAYAEIWASATNDRDEATLIATVKAPANTYSHVGLEPGVTWYYWLRLKDAAGNTSTWYPGGVTSGIGSAPTTDAAYLLEQLQGAVGLAQVAEEIARPVSLVDPLKFKVDWELGNVNIQKLAEKTFDDNERVHSTAQVSTESGARATADEALAQSITTVQAAVNDNAALIQAEQTARASGDSALAQSITTVQTRLDTGDYAVVKQQSEATASLVEGVNAKYLLQVDANGHVAAVQLGSDGNESSMVWLADKFLIAKPDGTGIKQLLTIGTVNGMNVLGFDGYLLGAGGTFSGSLSAVNGTFRGELAAASGTFAGSLLAGTLDLSKVVGPAPVILTTPGTHTLTVPADATSMRVTMVGGGGGGGAGHWGEWANVAGIGGGGGAGQYTLAAWDNLPAGATVSVFVGAGGSGGVGAANGWAGNSGSAGQDSYVNVNGYRYKTAAGGGGGGGGGVFVGDNNNASYQTWATGHGGSGYPSGNTEFAGKGGTTTWGSGGYNPGRTSNGTNGEGYGSGGGGGGYGSQRAAEIWPNYAIYNGGNGASGRVIVEFYNQNAVVLRTEFTSLTNRVTTIETDRPNFWQSNANMTADAIGSFTLATYGYYSTGGWQSTIGWHRDGSPLPGAWRHLGGSSLTIDGNPAPVGIFVRYA